jgi:hypothetical protein
MLGGAFAGMVGQQLVEIGAGRAPLDIKDPKIMGHMIRGTAIAGYFGDILADYLTAPDSDARQKLIESDLLGPSVSTITRSGIAGYKTGAGIVQALQGKSRRDQYGQAEWARLLHTLTPGQNIFYAKGALDYHLFNEVHNFMGDTGYLGVLRNQMRHSKDLFGNRQKPWGE